MSEREYPILGTIPKQYIPWDIIAPHEAQARYNHYQSLERLAERGGLSWAEALAVLEDKKWCDAIQNDKAAELIVKKLVLRFNELNGKTK